jgi:hypothetical protein
VKQDFFINKQLLQNTPGFILAKTALTGISGHLRAFDMTTT